MHPSLKGTEFKKLVFCPPSDLVRSTYYAVIFPYCHAIGIPLPINLVKRKSDIDQFVPDSRVQLAVILQRYLVVKIKAFRNRKSFVREAKFLLVLRQDLLRNFVCILQCHAFDGTDDVSPASSLSGWVTESGNTCYYTNGTAHTGWLVTDTAPDGTVTGLQRYWLDSSGILAVSRLIPPEEAGYPAFALSDGTIARGKCTASDGSLYLADNDGSLLSPGWHA